MRKNGLTLFALLLFPVALVATGFSREPRVRGAVTIEGVSVCSCTKKEAMGRLAPLFFSLENARVTVLLSEGRQFVFRSPALQTETDFDEVFRAALRVKKGEKASLPLRVRFRASSLSERIAALAKEERREPKNAFLRFTPNASVLFHAEKEEPGRALDEFALFCAVQKAFEEVAENIFSGQRETREEATVVAPYRALAPRVRVQDLADRHEELARFSTRFAASSPARKHNIALAAKRLCGAILEPHEKLSFNDLVGERSEKAGFLPAKVIENGVFADGVGGGVCQVSGTLYNAALLAGARVLEFHPHSLAVSYLPAARDAMVSFGTADLAIENPFDTPLFLRAVLDSDTLTFVFYGKPDGVKRALCAETVQTVPPPEPVWEEDDGSHPDLAPGERLLLQRAQEGVIARCFLLETRGKAVRRILLRTSSYRAVGERGVIGRAKRNGGEEADETFPKEKGAA